MTTERLRTYVDFDDKTTLLIDTIDYEGSLWLVIWSAETPYPNMRKPARLIRLPSNHVRDLGERFLGSDTHAHRLAGLLTKSALDGASQSIPLLAVGGESIRLDVREAPDLLIRR